MGKSNKFFLAVLYFLSVSLFVNASQTDNDPELRLARLKYTNSLGEKGVTLFNYNNKGVIYKALWHLINGKRNSLNYYEYDKNENLARKYREFSDNKTSTQTFKYNSEGKLIFEKFRRSDGVKGEVLYSYDSSGKLLKAECKGLNGWFHGVINYKYGSKDSRLSAVISQEGINKGEITYTYNGKGLLIKEYWDFTDKWDQTFLYEYEFIRKNTNLPFTSSNPFINITSGFRIKDEDYDYSGKSGGPSDYFHNGKKLEKKIFTRSDGLKTETFYFYNSNNELISSLRRYADGKSAIFSYLHNANRQLMKREGLGTDGFRSEESYSYDELGKLIKAVWDNFDSWLTGDISFKHNENGNLVSGIFSGSGEKKFNADIKFSFDKDHNLTSIDWKFSFPGTQTYIFNYLKN